MAVLAQASPQYRVAVPEGPIAAKAGPLLAFVVLLRAGWPGVEIGGCNGAQAACSYPLQSGVALREDHR